MVHSMKPIIVANGNKLTGIGFTLVETICFGSLEFITDRFSNLNLSPEGNDLGAVFVGIVHSGSPSLHHVLEESTDEDDTTFNGRGTPASPSHEDATW
jgi:hypothetical protein